MTEMTAVVTILVLVRVVVALHRRLLFPCRRHVWLAWRSCGCHLDELSGLSCAHTRTSTDKEMA